MKKPAIIFLTLLFVGSLAIFGFIAAKRFKTSEPTGKWTTASSDGFAHRCWFTSSVVQGKIYVIGGYGDSLLATTLDVFDPVTNAWHTQDAKGTFTQRASLTSCVCHDKIYVFGGALGPEKPSNMSSALEIFDPATSTWSAPKTTGSLVPRNNLCACLVGDKIYTMGGYNAESPGDVNTFEMFDPVTNTWSIPKTNGTFTPHGAFTANVVDGKIYAIGGFNDQAPRGHRVLSSVEVFDPKTNTWSALQTTGTFTARLLHSSGVVNGKIYIIGGTSNMRDPLTKDIVQIFDPKANTWSTPQTTGTFTPRSYLSSSVVGDKIYVIGGQDTNQVFSKVEVFTPSE